MALVGTPGIPGIRFHMRRRITSVFTNVELDV